MLKRFKAFAEGLPILRRRIYPRQVVTLQEQHYLIRQVTTDDIKAMMDVEREVYAGEIPWTRSAFLSELYSPLKHLYLCGEIDGVMVAFGGLRITALDGHITNIAVSPRCQGYGLGSFLMGELEKFAKNQRCETLSLEVRISNKEAQRLYRKLGFVSRAIKEGYYDQTNEDALDMVKYL